jgi:hypothetical protein
MRFELEAGRKLRALRERYDAGKPRQRRVLVAELDKFLAVYKDTQAGKQAAQLRATLR